MGTLGAEELERLRIGLIEDSPEARLKALDEARALDSTSRRNLIAACHISGQTTLSDEIIALLEENWPAWPTLTTLCLRGCSLLSAAGAAIIARQGNIANLELGNVPVTTALLIELAKLPLRKLVLWDSAEGAFWHLPHHIAESVASGAAALALLPTLTHLEWHNAPGDPAVTTALAASAAIECLAYTRKETPTSLLAPLVALSRLVELHVFSIDDEGLRSVVGLPNLVRLHVEHSPRVTDDGLAALLRCTQLRTFHFYGATVTSAGIMHLGSLSSLEEIRLHSNDSVLLTNSVAAAFGALPRLEHLQIHAPADLDDEGVANLSRATRLRYLCLNRCSRVTDASMPHIARLTALETLDLTGTAISDIGAVHLSGLIGLHELRLDRTGITPAALSVLKTLTSLRILSLNDCSGLTPMDIGPFHCMSLLEELGLQQAGPLNAAQTKLLTQCCPKLRELRCALAGPGALAPLTSLTGLRSLWITAANDIEDAEWGLVERLRELWSLVIVDAPWLTDAGLVTFGRMHGLEAVGIAGCPAITDDAARMLAMRLHLDWMSHIRRWYQAHDNFVILSGQFLCRGRTTHISARHNRRSTPSVGVPDALTALASEALAPYQPPIDEKALLHRWRDPDSEETAEDAVHTLEDIGRSAVVPALAAALAIGPSRWAYAGWALVRLARAGLTEAREALQHAHDSGGTVTERDHAGRFLALLSG